MSLEIKKGNSAGVNTFLVKRGEFIKHLVLQDCNIEPHLADSVAGKLTSLQSVTVDCTGKDQDAVGDEDIVALQRMCSGGALSKLNFNRMGNVSLSVIDGFISNFGSLTNLSLSYCTHFSDNSLANVAISCPKLRVISLRCTMIGDVGLSDLSKHCSTLISADFSECRRVTDIGVESVASKNCDLQEIIIDKCPGVTETALVALAKGCHNLQAISMEATGIRKLPSALVCLGKLRQLKLLGCSQLTHPPVEVVQQASTPAGIKQLLSFFLDFQLTYRIKVFVIGEPGVGKSALIRCLTFDNPLLIPQENVGYSGVFLWDPSSLVDLSSSDEKYIFEIWELPDDIVGLGDVFYIEPAVYIVAFDLSDSAGIDSVIRNVLSIWARFPNACLLVVGTHSDALDDEGLITSIHNTETKIGQLLNLRKSVAHRLSEDIVNSNSAFNSQTLPAVCQRQVHFLNGLEVENESLARNLVYVVSCRSRQGITDLRQNLLRRCSEHAAIFPQLSHRLTPALVQLYEDVCQLRSRSTVVLPWSEFAYFAERAGIPNKDIERDTYFLHNAGVIFDFRRIANSSTVLSDSLICIDPSRFLQLLNNIHTPDLFLRATEEEENLLKSLNHRGQILGRMLPALWKIADTDQLELIEILARQLGLICPISSALPPASWDKLLPPLPLGAHRCAFIRRIYSLPHFFSRLPALARPIHWQPDLAEDEFELSVCFRMPGELISLLQSTFHRLIASLPSSFCNNKNKTDLLLTDWDLSTCTMLLRFNLEYNCSDSIEILMCASLSATEGVSISARINAAEFSSDVDSSLKKAAMALWFYCTCLSRTVYTRLAEQLSGVPMSIYLKWKQFDSEHTSLSLPAMLAAWQKAGSQEQSSLSFPPVLYPTSADFESLPELFDYLSGKLRSGIASMGLRIGLNYQSATTLNRTIQLVSVVGDGVIVNDGCFRRGKSKNLTVHFIDNNRSRRQSSTSDSTASFNANSFRPFVYGSGVSPTRAAYVRPSLLHSTLLGRSALGAHLYPNGPRRLFSAQYDSRFVESDIENSEEIDSEQDDRLTKDTISGDYNDFTDHLSILSGAITNQSSMASQSGSLPSLDTNTQPRKKRTKVSYVEKGRRHGSPPPCIKATDHLMSGRICIAKEEECNDPLDETLCIGEEVDAQKAASLVYKEQSPGLTTSPASFASPITPTHAASPKSQLSAQSFSPDEGKTELSVAAPQNPRSVENHLLTPDQSSKLNGTTAQSAESSRSSPSIVHSGGRCSSSLGEDSGLVGFDEDYDESEAIRQIPTGHAILQIQKSPRATCTNVADKTKVTTVTTVIEEEQPGGSGKHRRGKEKENSSFDKVAAVSDGETHVTKPQHVMSPRPDKRKFKMSSLSFRKRKPDAKSNDDATSSVGNLLCGVPGDRTSSYRSKKDRTKCLCS